MLSWPWNYLVELPQENSIVFNKVRESEQRSTMKTKPFPKKVSTWG